jgi:hypothetical protein
VIRIGKNTAAVTSDEDRKAKSEQAQKEFKQSVEAFK